MKLPKNFGGGMGNLVQQAQQAMEKAKQLEADMEDERIPIDKGPVKVVVNGAGKLITLKIDPSAVDPEDLESLEDLIVSAARDGFDRANEERNAKMQSLMPGLGL